MEAGSISEPLITDVDGAPARRRPGGPKQKPEGAWYAALGKSIAYVWPKKPLLQVRFRM